jgi:segregation and condensation protein A
MSLSFISNPSNAYQVATPVYEGPLDLLLNLIERAELDITKLSLAQVTDQYLAYLEKLSQRSAEQVSAFLVIAARLIQIKSEVLLPRPPPLAPGEEDLGEALARQLIAYKRIKLVANNLAQRQEVGLRTYLSFAPRVKVEGQVDLSGLVLSDLVTAARQVFSMATQHSKQASLDSVVSAPKISIREKVSLIIRLLQTRRANFRGLLGKRQARLEVVVTFSHYRTCEFHFVESTKRNYSESKEPAVDWQINEEIELEFGE